MDKTKIIVVEDNVVYCEYVCNMLAREGCHTVKAYHLSTAKNICNKHRTMTSWLPTCVYPTATV